MKKTTLNLMLTLVCVAALAVGAVAAAMPARLMTVKIPFAFNLGNQTLPAGEYSINSTGTNGLLVIRNTETFKSVACITQRTDSVTANAQAQLDFHRYGDQYFLARVKEAGSASNELPRSRREREAADAAKNLAGNQAKPELVAVKAE